jgi:hypothetical protein
MTNDEENKIKMNMINLFFHVVDCHIPAFPQNMEESYTTYNRVYDYVFYPFRFTERLESTTAAASEPDDVMGCDLRLICNKYTTPITESSPSGVTIHWYDESARQDFTDSDGNDLLTFPYGILFASPPTEDDDDDTVHPLTFDVCIYHAWELEIQSSRPNRWCKLSSPIPENIADYRLPSGKTLMYMDIHNIPVLPDESSGSGSDASNESDESSDSEESESTQSDPGATLLAANSDPDFGSTDSDSLSYSSE